MDYLVKPREHQFSKLRRKVEQAARQYSHSIDIESVDFYTGFQSLKHPAIVEASSRNKINISVDPEKEWEEEIGEEILSTLLEIEFIEKTEYNTINFVWQEILKDVYTTARKKQVQNMEARREDGGIVEELNIVDELSEPIMECEELLYRNTGLIGEKLVSEMLEEYGIEELPGLKMSEVKETVKQVYN